MNVNNSTNINKNNLSPQIITNTKYKYFIDKQNYNNWQRPKVKLQFMFMNRKYNDMTLL